MRANAARVFARIAVVCVPGLASFASARADSMPAFEDQVQAILTAHCLRCHGNESRQAGLDLRTVSLMLRGGDSGPAIEPGSAEKSLLWQKLADKSMPPEKELPLTASQLAVVKAWIEAGAHTSAIESAPNPEATADLLTPGDRDFWSFQPPRRPAIPTARRPELALTPIDAFLLERLEANGLGYAPVADRRTLIRRLSLDLVGLPPEPAEVQAFVSDEGADAYERLVDRLLSSPHFGERWGRHWLDVVGYVDTIGDDTDAAIPKVGAGKWLYRDYVVDAFNRDLPLDQFVLEQMAGDELVDWRSALKFSPRMRDLLVATGFLRTAADETMQNELNTADIRHAVLQHTMEVVSNSLLGLTIHCARCHSHKYDPIPQEDYYRLLAVFTPAYNPQAWLQPPQRELPDIAPAEKAEADRHNAEIDKLVAATAESLAALLRPHEERLFAEKLAGVPEPIRADTKVAVQKPAHDRSEIEKYLAGKFEALLKVSTEEVVKALGAEEGEKREALERRIADLKGRRRTWGTLQAVYDVGPAPATYLLRRGNHETPGPEVEPGALRVLCDEATLAPPADSTPKGSSGRRLALARSLFQPGSRASGLVARVYVNRVWGHLFGEGIVATAENLGKSGAPPTHPELIDWLATEFIQGGWRTKRLIALLVRSRAYQQASKLAEGAPAPGLEIDPGNMLVWRMRLRPLEAEIVRDSMGAVAGCLDPKLGGPPQLHDAKPDGTVAVKDEVALAGEGTYRRSLYILARRRYHVSLLETFDQPEMTSNCPRRSASAVVGQALAIMNDATVIDLAGRFARRVERVTPEATAATRVDAAFGLALGRPATEEERGWAGELLAAQASRYHQAGRSAEDSARGALAHLCQMLYGTNEFLYIP